MKQIYKKNYLNISYDFSKFSSFQKIPKVSNFSNKNIMF
jgi:hypothetical protein